MKKFLLFGILALSLNYAKAQYPCPIDYKVTNGGGNCPDRSIPGFGTVSATGTVTLTFESAVNPSDIPAVLSATDITDPNNPINVLGVYFGPGTLNNNGTVTYCYYLGPNNNNNLAGKNSSFSFTVSYDNQTRICGGDIIILPVSFKTLTLARASQNVTVKWETSFEQNNRGFYVQKLTNGTWENVAFVFSAANAGNSSTPLSYSYTDFNNSKGITQYRILQVDLDNKARFSDIRSIRGLDQLSKVIVYPNPSNTGKINILFEAKGGARNVSVSDISGRLVKQFTNVTVDNLSVELNQSGVYSIQITDLSTSAVTVEKVIIKKR